MSQYVLGTSDHELSRLELQQQVWGTVTEHFLDRLRVPEGARVLDVGCGPGFVLQSLHARVGNRGKLTALDESATWMPHLARTVGERGWRNVHLVQRRIEDFEVEPGAYDLIFLRWVLSFLPEPAALIAKLARGLRTRGALAIQDYNHEGCSLFPESPGFDAVVGATRDLIASRGGDLWIAGRLPGYLRAAGLDVVDFTPHVLSGAPGSPAFRWASAFFPHHSEAMVASGVLSEGDRDRFLREWEERRVNPDAMFFSPIVVDCAGRKD
jgi:SAM-dependent methyltransferase